MRQTPEVCEVQVWFLESLLLDEHLEPGFNLGVITDPELDGLSSREPRGLPAVAEGVMLAGILLNPLVYPGDVVVGLEVLAFDVALIELQSAHHLASVEL